MLKRSIVLFLTLPIALAIAACSDDTEEVAPADGNGGNGNGNSDDSAVQISASDFSFSPSTLDVDPGTEVGVNISNDGNVQHTFTIDALGIDETIDPGEEVTVSFTPEGSERFYCRFHESAGMEGTVSTGEDAGAAPTDDAAPTEEPGNEFSY